MASPASHSDLLFFFNFLYILLISQILSSSPSETISCKTFSFLRYFPGICFLGKNPSEQFSDQLRFRTLDYTQILVVRWISKNMEIVLVDCFFRYILIICVYIFIYVYINLWVMELQVWWIEDSVSVLFLQPWLLRYAVDIYVYTYIWLFVFYFQRGVSMLLCIHLCVFIFLR